MNPRLTPEPWATPGDPLGLRLSASAALCDLVRGDIGEACEELTESGWAHVEPIFAEDGLICSDGVSTHVVLQGTDSAADVFKDFLFWRRGPWKHAPGMGWFAVGAKRYADRVLPEILDQLADIRDSKGTQDVYLHCHSLSAGAGDIMIIPIAQAGATIRDAYLFEEPRPLGWGGGRGSKKRHDDFCRRYDIRCWRILSLRDGIHDWVPQLPPMATGARHGGESLGVKSGRDQGGVVLISSSGSDPAKVRSGPAAKAGWRSLKKYPSGPPRWRILTRLSRMPRAHGMEHIAEALGRREFPDVA